MNPKVKLALELGRPLAHERAERAMAAMLTRLAWWAGALRDARRSAPYDRALA